MFTVTQLVSDQSGISRKLCLSSLLPGLVITALYLTLRITIFFHTQNPKKQCHPPEQQWFTRTSSTLKEPRLDIHAKGQTPSVIPWLSALRPHMAVCSLK